MLSNSRERGEKKKDNISFYKKKTLFFYLMACLSLLCCFFWADLAFFSSFLSFCLAFSRLDSVSCEISINFKRKKKSQNKDITGIFPEVLAFFTLRVISPLEEKVP